MDAFAAPADRRRSVPVKVGHVEVGGASPIVVQSMTNTDTADADATAIQVAQLAHAGSELVRVTVNNDGAAAAVPDMLRKRGYTETDVDGVTHANWLRFFKDAWTKK